MGISPGTQVRLIFLPKPRRSRHPYQWACMLGLLFYSILNLVLGPASHSPLLLVQGPSNVYLNVSLLAGSIGCLAAMFVPDNLWRLYMELSGHLLLITTAAMFTAVAGQGFVDTKHTDGNSGLSLNLVMFLCITVAAIGRTYELAKTIHRAWFRPDSVGAIVETDRDTER